MNIVSIILAAGASLRLGEPKQLLLYRERTLLRRAVHVALDSRCSRVIVVLGAHAELLQKEIADLPASVAFNQHWQSGMGSSIGCGVRAIDKEMHDDFSAALITLCDQPLIDSRVLNQLIRTYGERRPAIVASQYISQSHIIRGVPALFDQTLFAELSRIEGRNGAKDIIRRLAANTVFVSVPEAATDIDTWAEYRLLQEREETHDRCLKQRGSLVA